VPPGCHTRLPQFSSKRPRCQGLLLFIRTGASFGELSHPSRLVAFTFRSRTILRTCRHHFLFAKADVVRPRARNARPPASCGETEPPDARFASGSRCRAHRWAFRLSAADFSRVRFSSPVARLSPRGSQGHTGQVTIFGQVTSRLLRSACYPCHSSVTALPDRLPSCVRIPTCKTCFGLRGWHESTPLCSCLSACAA
jgi:hypothetical protein